MKATDTQLKKIMESPRLMTLEELIAYQNRSQLSEADQYRLEYLFLSHPANQDLLEAFEANPLWMKTIAPKMKSSLSPETIVAWFSVISLIAILIWSFLGIKPSSSILINTKELKTKEFKSIDLIPEPTEIITNSGNGTLTESSSSNEVLPSEPREMIEPIDSKSTKLIENKIGNENWQNSVKPYPAIFLGNFKITDYASFRSEYESSIVPLSGLPASNEHNGTINESLIKYDTLSYNDWMRLALQLLEKKQYLKSIHTLQAIAKDYPNDENTLFYSALSYYLLEQYTEAIPLFIAIRKDFRTNFSEEATWYLALSYHHIKDQASCLKLIDQIILQEGFYTQKAKQLKASCY
ncbi:MAG: hypothetical protein JXR60_07040 [Bacteroidales bacterium]|nr:hypothetical protein [Bacteroidales bacterium]